MYLGVQASEAEQANLQGPHCIFQQAALLANTEVMIQAVELWQEIDLDLVPCEPPESTSLHLSLRLQNKEHSTNKNVAVSEAEPVSAEPATVEPASTETPAAAPDVENAENSADITSTENKPSVKSDELAGQEKNGASSNQSRSISDDGQPHIALVFDYATLIQLKPLSQELELVLSISSSSIDLRVQLDQLSVSADEMAMIEAGAVMVMPAAFEAEWGVVAVSTSPEVPLRFGGSVKQVDQTLQVQFARHDETQPTALDSTDDDTNASLTVWCEQLCSVPVDELLGFDSNTQSAKLHSLDARSLSIVQGESTVALGSLLPYGRGSVVAVSERLMNR